MEYSELKTRLLKLDTPEICDTNKALRVIDPEIRPIKSGFKFVGVARTVRCHEDFLTIIKALADSEEGEVLVVDSQASRSALAGELFSTEAARRGLAGIVIDGAFRDVSKVRAMNFPVYSRSIIPVSGTTTRVFETQIPISCGGVEVNPGDILLMKYTLEAVDRDKKLAYLESTNEANLTLYQRHGFELVGNIQAGNSPSLFPMIREPKQGSQVT